MIRSTRMRKSWRTFITYLYRGNTVFLEKISRAPTLSAATHTPLAMDPVTLSVTLPAALAPLLAVDGRTLGLALALLLALALARLLYHPSVPRVSVRLTADELATASVLSEARMSGSAPAGHIPCIDPSTGRFLGSEPAASEADVSAKVARARLAQSSWALSR